jgi:hypothetical protein
MFKSPWVIGVLFGAFVAAALPVDIRPDGHPPVTRAAGLECILAPPGVNWCTYPNMKMAGPSTGGLTGTVLAAAAKALSPESIG